MSSLAKLKSFGLCEEGIRRIRSYLTGRIYGVQVTVALSHVTNSKRGVPFGLVIGPLLFLLFVSNFTYVISVLTLLFADDVKTVSPRSQSGLLQSSLYNA